MSETLVRTSLHKISLMTLDSEIRTLSQDTINTFSPVARILGGVLILFSIASVSIAFIRSKKKEDRTTAVEHLLSIAIGSFILGLLIIIIGFYNSI